MAEISTPFQQVIKDYICDCCGEGKMRPTGVMMPVYPPLYQHCCEKPECKKIMNFPKTYPCIECEPTFPNS